MPTLRLILIFICLGFPLTFSGVPLQSSPQATTLTVSNPYCSLVTPSTGACYINIRYLSASDPLLTHVEITVNGKVRAYMTGFFETSAALSAGMLNDGLQVVCGKPNVSGIPNLGYQYSVGISVYANGSPTTTDTAVVTCPAFEAKINLPFIKR